MSQRSGSFPIRLRGIDHVVIRCAELEPVLAFYRDVLGCTLERTVEGIGLHQLRAGASLIDLVPVGTELGGDTAPSPERFNMAHLCLRIADPDWEGVRAHLASHGIEWREPARRYGADGYGRSIYLEDPEGNVVELKGEPEPAGGDA